MRLLPQPDGFECFGWILEHSEACDLPCLDGEHERPPRDHFDPVAAPKVGSVRNHDVGARLREAVRFKLDGFKC
jgi:hypothetical protein